MIPEEYKKAADFWIEKDKNSVKMPEDMLIKEIQGYITSNNTCALATGEGSFIRCTPIEYAYHHNALWIFTEGGLKFVGLQKNKNVCIAIFDKYKGFGKLKGMQISGVAEIVEPFSKEYDEAAKYKKIPIESLKKLPSVMNLIKIVPETIDFLNSDLKKAGYDSRQQWNRKAN